MNPRCCTSTSFIYSYPCILAQFRSSESLHQGASFRTRLQPPLVKKKRRTLQAHIDVIVKPSECRAFETGRTRPCRWRKVDHVGRMWFLVEPPGSESSDDGCLKGPLSNVS